MQEPIRNRIKEHGRVRAGDLIPQELNFRSHPELQRGALEGLYQEIGFARSLLAYELPDGRLKLLDGHLRRDIDPEMLVDVEILDVNDDEARTLLLNIDPLASLAETQNQIRDRLMESRPVKMGPEQWLIIVRRRDEKHQVEVLERLQGEGLECKALVG